jgi:EthD domain
MQMTQPAPVFKILMFLKRRPGMSLQAFRDYYEGVHSKLGEKYSAGVSRYVRRYIEPLPGSRPDESHESDFDVITETWFEDRSAFERVARYLTGGELPAEVLADEERLFDRSKSRFTTVFECESNL